MEIINLNYIPSVQVHDTAVTRPLITPHAWVGYARLASDSSRAGVAQL